MRGFLVVLAVGLVLLVAAALRDRHTRRLAERALGRPVRELEQPPAPTPDERQRAFLERFRHQHEPLALRLADASLATWSHPDTVEVAAAEVLCCPQGVSSLRELAPSIHAARGRGHALVVASADFDPELVALVCGSPRGTSRPVLLVGDVEACEQLATLTGTIAATRLDLQAGSGPRLHGRVARLVADAQGCWISDESAGEA